MEPPGNIALRAARKAGELIVRATEQLDKVRIEQKGHNDFGHRDRPGCGA